MMGRKSAVSLLIAVLFVAVLSSSPAYADEKTADWYSFLKDIPIGPGKLDIGGSLRIRYEYFNNFNSRIYNTDDVDDILQEQVRINFDYHLNDKAHLFVELQDSHYWLHKITIDMFPGSCPFQNHIDLRQAYVEWKNINNSPLGFKIGRQSIRYGDKRVFAPGNWSNVNRYWWDAAKLYIDTEPVKIDVIAAQRVRTDPHGFDDEHFDYNMYAIYAQIQKLPVKWDLFYTLYYDDHGTTVGESGVGDRKTHTFGTYVDGKLGKNIDFGGTLALQCGKFGADDIKAHGYNARVGYTFDHAWQPRIGAEFSFGSGDADPTNGDHETFDGIFSAVCGLYGQAGLFAWMNIEDYKLTFSVKPNEKLKVWLNYHYFELDKAADAWYYYSGQPQRRDATGAAGCTLGHGVDLMAKWKVTKNVELFAGYAHFFAGSFVENTPGGSDDADWAFLQFTYSF